MKHILYLASKSSSRQYLLNEAQIPFIILGQSADETACDWAQDLEPVVRSIARHKMAHVDMPQGSEGQVAFVLTADTLTQDSKGNIHGKPENREDAIAKIRALEPQCRVATAFCLKRLKFHRGIWQVDAERECCVISTCEFNIPDHWLDRYFEKSAIGYQAAGGMAIETYGMQFLKAIYGSYSAVIGLPLFELRQVLDDLGFFED
jgi:septum formation protein